MRGTTSQGTLLIIDDTPDSVKVILECLSEANFTVLFAEDGEEGIQTAEYAQPDLIVLDVMMPSINGFEVCQILKSRPQTQAIPIIFMSALTDTREKVKGFELGAADYITKPLKYEEFLARITTHLKLRRQQQQLEEEIQLRKQAQQSLQHLSDLLASQALILQAQKQTLETRNQELDAFAHMVAHDLKNPLNAIINITAVVAEHCAQQGLLEHHLLQKLEFVEQAGQQAFGIIEALLALAGVSRQKQIEFQLIDMEEIIDRVLAQRLAPMISEYQGCITTPASWPQCHSYGPWVEEIWTNYITNGLKYGGRPPQLELGADIQSTEMIRFWVRDNGRGLTVDEQKQLFTPFNRLSRHIEGHGLGLAIVKKITEKLNGHVGIDSIPGQGSLFYFVLPKQHSTTVKPQVLTPHLNLDLKDWLPSNLLS